MAVTKQAEIEIPYATFDGGWTGTLADLRELLAETKGWAGSSVVRLSVVNDGNDGNGLIVAVKADPRKPGGLVTRAAVK